MRVSIFSALLLSIFAAGCDPNAACRSVNLGDKVSAADESGCWYLSYFHTLESPANFDKGPAKEVVCCRSRDNLPVPDRCTATISSTDCTQYDDLRMVELPYSHEVPPYYHGDDRLQHCWAALRNDTVVAVWSREWY